MKKILAVMCAVLMLVSMTACGTAESGKTDDGKYVIGICQLMTHDALDAATKGFQDALIAALGEENLTFKHQDAAGKQANCDTIVDGFVSEKVDLILANATTPLQSAATKTVDIPILGTSITDYASALGIENWNGTVGGNISGTSDLAPLDQQAAMVKELFPDAKVVGLLYCSGEPNSIYQVTEVEKHLAGLGYETKKFSFVDANDLASVTQTACDGCDVLYIPTDNTAATYTETIANVAIPAKTPIIAGEANTCAGCGVATLSIDYYDLGYTTGQMAAKILKGEEKIESMAVAYAPEVTKMYNQANCEALGITIPEDYQPIG